MIAVSVLIPTFHRNPELERALLSCVRQEGIRPDQYEIVVVDNSADGRASPVVSRLAAQHAVAIHYRSERRPGITHARNTAVGTASGELVAFLDDDGEADPHWVASLWATYQECRADVMWGALLPRFDGPLNGWDWLYQTYFTRRIGRTGTAPKTLHGTNNSCIRRSAFTSAAPFPPQLGLLGGGDIAFFRRLQESGGTFTYSAAAIIYDHIPVERISYRYLLTRNFWQGQANSYMHTLPGMRSPRLLARSLIAGIVNVPRYGCIAAAQLVRGRYEEAALSSLKVSRAIGRLAWMRPFRRQRYGLVKAPGDLAVPAKAIR